MLSVKKRALVDNFSKDSKIPISTGLTRLFEDKALGGCTQGIKESRQRRRKGLGQIHDNQVPREEWNQAVDYKCMLPTTTKTVPSYWNMIKDQMKDENKKGMSK